MGRRASREIAMKLIYQLEIQKDSREEQINNTLEQYDLNENDREYILDVVKGVFKNQEEIDGTIEKFSKGWKLSRISKVDLAILRLAIYEMCHRDDIPFTVAINEAVELAKNYSGEESGSFINGILGKVVKVKLMSADGNENRDEE
ncbi:MAG TPA: N utilization substance protein B [Hungateiclostridium thermocellum]|jgi:N utilization substance protein B|uniref:Transcription antitermination protein NusB n=2 Tax=Acetivibrio thermocellus TaxID=1515 RepID=NUSB_ACET2|nr:transcription antitermination factor NusB [Acetivibrio thermocellus]A3DDP0.1 RecName: Full=Transcription antitermination protein NusB; AltName: Full=Antitermination factor NusB [Acetivibrio thermocellus ATCC 27405]CDG35526.1 N utilization substance protein B homolog [Acetivibrio thermocellus BC1]ABN52069.1 NusB antitermination factor [Acetivibrio thermocellus ATCC 27405]ADU74450.1 NusB antitermination factor [Acetivibrio thermocellus DSM 1313]ALX08393.1 NusB antitermination factor [Acetivib